MMNDLAFRHATPHFQDMDEDDDDGDAYDWNNWNNNSKQSSTDEDEEYPDSGEGTSRLGKQKYDGRAVRKLLKPEAIASRGLKEWARLEPVLTVSTGALVPIILYDSPSRQPSILGRGFLPPGHDPALFHPLSNIRISRIHTLIWRELRDCNGDNTDINNYVIRIQSQGSTGTSVYRRAGQAAAQVTDAGTEKEQREMRKMEQDAILDLEYDPNAGYGLILGNKLYEYRLVLSPLALLIPRGAPPPRIDNLIDHFLSGFSDAKHG